MTSGGTFFEIAIILGLATVLGFVGRRLHQPLIIMFLAAGILAGPSVLGIIQSYEQIELLAQMGIAILLFIVGLRLDINLIRTTGPVALVTGVGQIAFTAAIGFVISLLFGMTTVSALYVAIALTFSSTIIIVKLLSDKKEIDALHGQIAIGILIVQDIAAIAALVVLTTMGSRIGVDEPTWLVTMIVVFKGVGFLASVLLITVYVIPGLLRQLASSQELLVLFAITWAIFLGGTSEFLGFSKEIGAFLAGVSLASSHYRDTIVGRLISLRDFLFVFFFIDLGARLDWSTVGAQVIPSIWLSIFVLVGKPLIIIIIMGVMGYRRRTGFISGITLAQISEFSLIVVALGHSLGHIGDETIGMITLIGVVTIFVSTYLILSSAKLYQFLKGPLKFFERKNPYRETLDDLPSELLPKVDVILVGLGSYGSGIASQLLARNKTFVGVDFDPVALERWLSLDVPCRYGDMSDPEMLEQMPLSKASWVVCTVRNRELNLALLNLLKNKGFNGKVALTAVNEEEADLYLKSGAHVVFRPFRDAAEQAVDSLTDAMDVLPDESDMPISFKEIRIGSGSAYAGKKVRDIPLRSAANVSIIAVSRGGQVHYTPGPDFQIYPGDRLILVGLPTELKEAENLLNKQVVSTNDDLSQSDRFDIAEIALAEDSVLHGTSLADAQFRQNYSVTVIGIRRNEESIYMPGPFERLEAGDRLLVIGTTREIENVKKKEPL